MTSIVGTVSKAMVYKLQIVTGMMSSIKVQNSEEQEEEEKEKVEQEAKRMERRRSDRNDNIQC